MGWGSRKLLLADDSTTIQKVVSLTFADEGLEVTTVSDGDEAVRYLEENEPPDIVLADVFMPGLDGYRLCERIKSDPRLRHIPVVLLIGTFEPFSVMEARRVGANDVLTKPFQSIRGLVNKVGSLLGGSDAKKEPEASDTPEPEGLKVNDDFSAASWTPNPATSNSPTHPEPAYREESTTHTVNETRPFDDFADDDLLIESKPADDYGTTAAEMSDSSAVAQAPDADAGFDLWDEPQEREHQEPALAELAYEQQQEAAQVESERTPREEEEALPVYAAPVEATFEDNVVTKAAAGESSIESSIVTGDREDSSAPPVYAARAAYATAGADAHASSDDTLLDLDDLEPAPVAAKAIDEDDFILDLDEDLFAPAPATYEEEPLPVSFDAGNLTGEDVYSAEVDTAGAFAEAAHGEAAAYAGASPSTTGAAQDTNTGWAISGGTHDDEQEDSETTGERPAFETVAQQTPQSFYVPALPHEEEETTLSHEPIEPSVVPAEEPVPATVESEFTDGSVEGDVAKPPVSFTGEPSTPFDEGAPQPAQPTSAMDAPVAATSAAVAPNRGGEQIGAHQLSPEAIDAIARRVIELLSDRVVREVAWEVVPELAELLIKRRLDEK